MERLVSGVVLATAALAAVLFLPIELLRVLAVIVAAIAAREYLQIVGIADRRRQVVAVAFTVLLCGAVARQYPITPEMLLLTILGWLAAEVLFGGSTVHDAAAAVMAPIYTGAPLGMLAVIHATHSWRATLMLVTTVIVSDSSQYYAGRTFGRHPLAPAISPKKTMEGAVGGVICGTVFAVGVGRPLFPGATVASLALLGLMVVTLGICGDLFESRLKRTAGMKDSAQLIPGHGGMLDRIDALLFAAPAFFLWVRALP